MRRQNAVTGVGMRSMFMSTPSEPLGVIAQVFVRSGRRLRSVKIFVEFHRELFEMIQWMLSMYALQLALELAIENIKLDITITT